LHQKTQHSNLTEENVEAQESHEMHSTEQNTSTMKLVVAGDSRSVIYMCEKCNKQFELKQEYELHMRVVHEQQEFTCNICNKSFTNQSDLKMHVTTHEVCVL